MQIWKKYFLLAYCLFATIFALSVTIFLVSDYRNDFQQIVSQTATEKRHLVRSLENLYRLKADLRDIKYSYHGVLIDLKEDGSLIYNSLSSENMKTSYTDSLKIHQFNNQTYLTSFSNLDGYQGQMIELIYAKDMSSFYHYHKSRLISGIIFFLLGNLVVAFFLYKLMKKIYQSIENIAHELRTPLTTIQGYSEYLLRAKMDEEEHFFVAQQLIEESQQLSETIEKLLIMGNLRDQPINMKSINLEEVIADLKVSYPDLVVKTSLSTINENPILLRSLFSNLLANAFRESSEVWIEENAQSIVIGNRGKQVEDKLLKKLNQRLPLNQNEYSGMGKGVLICHEIMKFHGGKLYYTSEKEVTTAHLQF